MKITEAEGIHYCKDCNKLMLYPDNDMVWYCPEHARKRGWNIIDGRPVKIPKNETKINTTTGETDSPTETGKSTS